jgi:two-component system, sporulation sensor kinase E
MMCVAQHGWKLVLDDQGIVVFAEPELVRALHYTDGEWIGAHIDRFVDVPDGWQAYVKGKDGYAVIHFVACTGTIQSRECVIGARDDVGHVHFLVCEPCLDTRHRIMQRFVEHLIHDGNWAVFLIDARFRFVEVSDVACRLFGFERGRIIGVDVDAAFGALPEEHRLIHRSILWGVGVVGQACSWTGTNGRHELIMDAQLLRDEEGQTIGAYVMFRDVTNMRAVSDYVQRNDRFAMIGQIAAGTAHEIRNPLTAIKGFMQLLHQSMVAQGYSREKQYTEFVLTEIERMNKLVNEFLYLSKAKKTTIERLDVAHVLLDILPLINNQAVLHGVRVSYQAAMNKPKVFADREQLKQVFMNLCRNGIESMASEGGVLSVIERVDREQQRVLIAIADTGTGIPPFLIDKIFDPFFTTKEDGTGLGLAVCQRIVHDMGGHIRVSSKGYGTMFVVSMPYAQ